MNPTTLTERPTTSPTRKMSDFMAIRDLESHAFFAMPLLQPGFAVLDAGCGTGTITHGIAEMVFPGNVTALDASITKLEHARRLAQGREILNTEYICGSATTLPFADETFDLVFSNALFEHLRNPTQTLREFYRVIRPGGFTAIASPDWESAELHPYPTEIREAIRVYRSLQETSGGNTRSGRYLGQWMNSAGFIPISLGEWMEEHHYPGSICDPIAEQLEKAGYARQARDIRDWSSQPEARFAQCWKYAIGLKSEH